MSEQDSYKNIPALTIQGIKRYVEHHIPPGDFLRAVLENNLKESFGRADEYNKVALFDIVKYCYLEIPSNCWGSKEKVSAWLEATRPTTEPPSPTTEPPSINRKCSKCGKVGSMFAWHKCLYGEWGPYE